MSVSHTLVARGQAVDPYLTDVESGLPNRLHFDVVFRVLFAAGSRGLPLTLVLIEPQGISTAKEEWHELGGRLLDVTRSMDLLARFDRDRYAVLMVGCNVHGGRVAAERLLHSLTPWLEGCEGRVSIGVAAQVADMTEVEDLVRMAGVALAAAKEAPDSAIETRP